MVHFEIIKEKTHDYWLELRGTDGGLVFENGKDKVGKPIWNMHAIVKWDGCVAYSDFSNGYSYDHKCDEDCQCCEQNMHICSLDNFIEVLKAIKSEQVKFFGEDSL